MKQFNSKENKKTPDGSTKANRVIPVVFNSKIARAKIDAMNQRVQEIKQMNPQKYNNIENNYGHLNPNNPTK